MSNGKHNLTYLPRSLFRTLSKDLNQPVRPQDRNGAAAIAAPPDRSSVRFSGGTELRLQRPACPHSDLSIFQKIGVAGPSSTPESDFRPALGARHCPSGILISLSSASCSIARAI